jgi:cell wall-associated NlpC family hydrolase
MAPERTSRPGGNLPGMRNSALATAALTSVALFSQTAGAAPATGDDGPSRDEVQQRVNNLYDRAESDTGTYNATRAAGIPRQRAGAPAGAERRAAGPATDDTRAPAAPSSAAPALADVARQWFDVARAKLGPTVPAALPADRMPARPTRPPRPAGDRPSRPTEPPTNALALEAPRAADRAVPELAAWSFPELTGGSVPALPSAPETRQEATTALPAASTVSDAPATDPGPSSLRATKQRSRQKLAQARELLAAHTAQASTPLAAIGPRPTEDTWNTPTASAFDTTGTQWQPRQQPQPQTETETETQTQTQADLTHDLPVTPGATFTPGLPAGPSAAFTPDLPVNPGPTFTTPTAPNPATPLPITPTPSPATPVVAHQAVDTGYDLKAAKVLAFARAQIGRPCVWGAAGPGSYDSSGLIRAAWMAVGVALPRTVQGQANIGTAVSLADVRVGDLVFFYDDLSHVGLYIGNGMMIHAPGPGAYIREESVYYAGESAIRGAVRPA